MAIHSREQLKQYCLRALGAPVLEVNCDDDQLEDRIDEALEYWRQYHPDGVEKLYMKHKISASIITLTTQTATSFQVGETVTGLTSGATAEVATEILESSSGANLMTKMVKGTFQPGEHIVGSKSGYDTTIVSCVLGVYDNKYIEIPDLVYGITNILPISNSTTSTNSIFNLQYQLRLNDLHDLTSTSMIYYTTAMSYLDLMSFVLNRAPSIRFNRMQGRLHLDLNWETDVTLGTYVIAECYRALDPAESNEVWNERWLKHYVTALFRRQWGQNLSKFSGMLLPGGVSIDGQGMYDMAMQEIKDLEDELVTLAAPLSWFMG